MLLRCIICGTGDISKFSKTQQKKKKFGTCQNCIQQQVKQQQQLKQQHDRSEASKDKQLTQSSASSSKKRNREDFDDRPVKRQKTIVPKSTQSQLEQKDTNQQGHKQQLPQSSASSSKSRKREVAIQVRGRVRDQYQNQRQEHQIKRQMKSNQEKKQEKKLRKIEMDIVSFDCTMESMQEELNRSIKSMQEEDKVFWSKLKKQDQRIERLERSVEEVDRSIEEFKRDMESFNEEFKRDMESFNEEFKRDLESLEIQFKCDKLRMDQRRASEIFSLIINALLARFAKKHNTTMDFMFSIGNKLKRNQPIGDHQKVLVKQIKKEWRVSTEGVSTLLCSVQYHYTTAHPRIDRKEAEDLLASYDDSDRSFFRSILHVWSRSRRCRV